MPFESTVRSLALVELIERATHRLTSTLEPQEVVREIVEQSVVLFPSCAVFLRSEATGQFELRAIRHPDPDREREIEDLARDEPVRPGVGLVGRVIETGEPLFYARFDETDLPVPQRNYALHLRPHSTLAMPITVNQVTVGVLSASALPGDPPLSESDFQIARLLANLAGQSLHNAERYQEARRAERQANAQRRMEEITRALSQTLDLDTVLMMVRDAVVEALGYDRAGVFIVDDEQGVVRGVWGTDEAGERQAISDQVFPVAGTGPFSRIMTCEIPYFLTIDYRKSAAPDISLGPYAALPFSSGDHVVGILAVDNTLTRRTIGEEEIAVLQPFCDQATVAIVNARLHQTLQRQLRTLETLQVVGDEVRATIDADTVLEILAVRARQLSEVTESAIFLYDASRNDLAWHCGDGGHGPVDYRLERRLSPRLTRDIAPLTFRCLHTREPVFIDGPNDPQLSPGEADWAQAENIKAAAGIPLHTDRESFGVLLVAEYQRPYRFTHEDVSLLETLAGYGSVALEKARLFESAQESYRQVIQINNNLRRAFIPDLPAQVDGLSIGTVFEPYTQGSQLGGDFFDLFALGPRRYGIVIADVAGHDLNASVQTAAAKYLLRAYAERTSRTSLVVSRLNQALVNQFAQPDYISLFFGVIDLDRELLRYTIAGHEPPVLILPGGTLSLLEQNDPLLGVDESLVFHQNRVRFPVGATLLLYTDGVTEARRGEEFLLTEGLLDRIRSSPQDDPALLTAALREEIHAFAGNATDDLAMLAVRRTASSK